MPPKLVMTVWIASSSGWPFASVTWPATMIDCGAPGRSIRNTRLPWVGATTGIVTAGAAPPFQLPKLASSAGTSLASVVSPLTMMVALPGLNQLACHCTRSSRVMPATLASVPSADLP